MKNFIYKYKVKILLTISFALLLVLLNNNVFATNVDIPDIVMSKAKELNYGYDNFVILQDSTTNEFYIPYESSCYNKDNYENNSWYITLVDGYDCLVSPSVWRVKLVVYRDGSFIETSICDINHNYTIQLSMESRELNIVYASKDVVYKWYEGKENGTIFFPIAPPEETPEIQEPGTLQEILEQEKLEMATMKEILGILPLILSVLVSLLGLRKAFQVLLNFLKVS